MAYREAPLDPATRFHRTFQLLQAWHLWNANQSQQQLLYTMAIQSRDANNKLPGSTDFGWYRLNDNNCGTWARWMIERAELTFPAGADIVNLLGIGVDGVADSTGIPQYVSHKAREVGEARKNAERFGQDIIDGNVKDSAGEPLWHAWQRFWTGEW